MMLTLWKILKMCMILQVLTCHYVREYLYMFPPLVPIITSKTINPTGSRFLSTSSLQFWKTCLALVCNILLRKMEHNVLMFKETRESFSRRRTARSLAETFLSTSVREHSNDIPKLRRDRGITMQLITRLCHVEISVRCLCLLSF